MMHRNLFALWILAIGASALVLSPAHDIRNVGTHHHRKLSSNVRSGLLKSPEERRRLRQKRCDSRLHSSESIVAATSTVAQTTTVEVPLNPAPSPPPESTTSQAPPPPPPPSTTTEVSIPDPPPSNGGEQFTGQLTWFNVGLGSCGGTNVDSDFIAAASRLLYDTFEGGNPNPNLNPICGKRAQVSFEGKTVTVTINDRCPECAYGDLDLSPAAFQQLADPGRGRLSGATWRFV